MAFSSSAKDRKDAQLLKDWTLEGGDRVLSRTRRGALPGEAVLSSTPTTCSCVTLGRLLKLSEPQLSHL